VTALAHIPVGVVVARRKAASQWIDYTWQPVSVLIGLPETPPWSLLSDEGETALFYAGAATVELHTSDTGNYRDNLAGDCALWVVLEPAEGGIPYRLGRVTADPSEGEANTETGINIVDKVPMPDAIRDLVEAFVAEHHVEHTFYKRKRKPADAQALARGAPKSGGESES
jgi:hypothetical protein